MKREKKNLKTVNKRMKEFKKDLSKWKEYDYVVINDDLKICYKQYVPGKNVNFCELYLITNALQYIGLMPSFGLCLAEILNTLPAVERISPAWGRRTRI